MSFAGRIRRGVAASRAAICTSVRSRWMRCVGWGRRCVDDVRYLILGRYLPIRYAARLAYEHTECNEVGRFAYDIGGADPDCVLDFYIYDIVGREIVDGKHGPSGIWRRLRMNNAVVVSGTDRVMQRYTPPVVFYGLRVHRREFNEYLEQLDKLLVSGPER